MLLCRRARRAKFAHRERHATEDVAGIVLFHGAAFLFGNAALACLHQKLVGADNANHRENAKGYGQIAVTDAGGIVKQHGFTTVQDFYTAFYIAQRATDAYQKECAKWEEAYGEKASPKSETMHEKIQRYKEKADRQNASQPYRSREKGAR